MSIRTKQRLSAIMAGLALAGGVTVATATPAMAGYDATGGSGTTRAVNSDVAPLAWYNTTALGGPIRTCYSSSCSVVIYTYYGEPIQWSHYAYNSAGNRWYYVRDSIGKTGWIYCGNVTAPC